jgi:hypothetical protein
VTIDTRHTEVNPVRISAGDRLSVKGTSTMSEMSNRQRALNAFHDFVAKHLPQRGRQADLLNRDAQEVVETKKVTRDDVLKVFLKLKPQHLPYRLDILESSRIEPTLLFSKQLWADTKLMVQD